MKCSENDVIRLSDQLKHVYKQYTVNNMYPSNILHIENKTDYNGLARK